MTESMEQIIRRIVRDELKAAFEALAASADACDVPYQTGDIESVALTAVKQASERAASVMSHVKECPDRTSRWGGNCQCWQYGVDPEAGANEG